MVGPPIGPALLSGPVLPPRPALSVKNDFQNRTTIQPQEGYTKIFLDTDHSPMFCTGPCPAPSPPQHPASPAPTAFSASSGKLIGYGKELAATLRQHSEPTDLALIRGFGTIDIARRAVARITCGLLRAQALEVEGPIRTPPAWTRTRRPDLRPPSSSSRSVCTSGHPASGKRDPNAEERVPPYAGVDRREGAPPVHRRRHRRHLPRSRRLPGRSAVAESWTRSSRRTRRLHEAGARHH